MKKAHKPRIRLLEAKIAHREVVSVSRVIPKLPNNPLPALRFVAFRTTGRAPSRGSVGGPGIGGEGGRVPWPDIAVTDLTQNEDYP